MISIQQVENAMKTEKAQEKYFCKGCMQCAGYSLCLKGIPELAI